MNSQPFSQGTLKIKNWSQDSRPKINKILIFSEKKFFFNISGNRTFQEIKLSSSKIKKFLIFRKMELVSVIFFLNFRKDFPSSKNKKTLKKFLILREMELSSPKLVFQEGTLKFQA